MGRLVTFSIGIMCLGLVAGVGLTAYTAAHPFDVGLVELSSGSAPGAHGQAQGGRTLG